VAAGTRPADDPAGRIAGAIRPADGAAFGIMRCDDGAGPRTDGGAAGRRPEGGGPAGSRPEGGGASGVLGIGRRTI
jgi:hypothetical protein